MHAPTFSLFALSTPTARFLTLILIPITQPPRLALILMHTLIKPPRMPFCSRREVFFYQCCCSWCGGASGVLWGGSGEWY